MKYVIKTHSGMIGVHDSGAVAYRAGERTQEFTVIGEQVTSFFVDRAVDLINEEFFDYQNDNDIDDGALPPDLDNEITEAFERLCDVIGKCKAWQLANAQAESGGSF